MNDPTIKCPSCKTEIKLTESLAAPLIEATRAQYERRFAEKEAEIATRENALRAQLADLARTKASIDQEVAQRLKSERGGIAAEEAKKARALLGDDLDRTTRELASLQEVLAVREGKLAEAQKAQAELIRKGRELDDARRGLELTVETRVEQSLGSERAKAKREAEAGLKLRVLEKEEQIASMARQIEDLKRKAEQGSQQLQGEVQEMELEALLRSRFPRDIIEPVPRGACGGDLFQRVMDPAGHLCGTILWEIKRTKNWSDGWLSKLRDDKRAANGDIALLVSRAVPEGVDPFDLIDGVWVTETRCAIPVAIALRQSLIELATARVAAEGQQTKTELVYQYLTGPRFRRRIESIVERFSDMQADLHKERKVMSRLWAKRETQIIGVLESTVGIYGDLQGIVGKTLQEIDGLDLRLLEAPLSNDEEPTPAG